MRISAGIAAVLVAATVGGWACSPGSGSHAATATSKPTPRAPRPLSALDRALAGIKPDGSWSATTALAVFSATFGELPGVTMPEGQRQKGSGTLALRMVQSHWVELTPQQQEAILRYAGRGAAPPGARSTALRRQSTAAAELALPDAPNAASPDPEMAIFQKLADDAAKEVGSRLHRSLTGPVRIEFPDQMPEGWLPGDAYLWTYGNYGPQGDFATASGCIINVGKLARQPEQAPYLRWMVLHEMGHCYQAGVLDWGQYRTLAPWVSDGLANWAAESITNGDGQPPLMVWHWDNYVTNPGKQLFSRQYDAIGFFVQLHRVGINPWDKFDPVTKAAATGGSISALQASGAVTSVFTDVWGSSWFRTGAPSTHWAMDDGFGIPKYDTAEPLAIELADDGEGAVSAKPNSGGIATLHSTAFVTHLEVVGAGRVGDPGGSLDRVMRAQAWDICTSPSGSCKCPPDSPNTPAEPEKAPMRLNLAVTGEAYNDSVMAVRGISKDEWCGRKKPSPSPSPGGGTSCATLLPAADVQRAVGVDIGAPTDIPYSAFPVACVWRSVNWSLQAQRKSSPGPVNPNAYGVGCQIAAGNTTVAYCVNADQGGVGGIVMTRSWSLSVVTHGISTDQFINGIIPILARTGA